MWWWGPQALPLRVNVTNNNSVALNVLRVVPTGPFQQSNNCVGAIAPGAFCTINVSFKPTVAGPVPGNLTITDDDVTGTQVVNLTGFGITVSSSTTTLAFGNVPGRCREFAASGDRHQHDCGGYADQLHLDRRRAGFRRIQSDQQLPEHIGSGRQLHDPSYLCSTSSWSYHLSRPNGFLRHRQCVGMG